MPNRKHGDYPLNDSLNHGSSGLGKEVDRLALDLIKADPSEQTKEEIGWILWRECWPIPYGADEQAIVTRALSRLRAMKEQIQGRMRSRLSLPPIRNVES